MHTYKLAFISSMLLLFTAAIDASAQSKKVNANKAAVISSIDKRSADLIRISDEIWANAETALRETKSAQALADYAEAQGFAVRRGVASMPTAFIAEYGNGKPIIGIMGEYDALPGISQKAQPVKEPLQIGGAGHGCGHNLFGVGSLAAAVSIKELLASGKLKGTVRFYGTPAEEAVGGKIYMAREGLFKDLDVCLDWHPAEEIAANIQSSQAMVDFVVEFKGKAAHAAADPWNGRSALDGVELFLDGVNMLREHVQPSVRMHYVIKDGGDVPNVVPEHAAIWMWVRDSKRSGVESVFTRVKEIAKGAGLMAGVESSVRVQSGDYEILINQHGAEALQKNIEALGPITYTPEEIAFAKKIQEVSEVDQTGLDGSVHPLQKTKDDPEGGSTDVGDISWIVPEITINVTTAPIKAPWHSWAVVACGGMSIGHKGMLYAGKALGTTMVDLFENEQLRNNIRDEFEKRRNGHIHKAYIPDGPPPLPGKK
ncbi:amidohydrolase [Chryseolinea sp. T2]|uniref:amidohydrolase n=1 Tax=Chryseolinea sp. T2 TaxID=3129255 RepID=UPI003076DB43